MTEPPDPPAIINFGQAQTGDIRTGDIAGRDHITINNYSVQPAASAGPAFQVPYPPNPLFRGRDAELIALEQALLGDVSGAAALLPAVSGTGGIGKTQLASEFAHKHRAAFPGGVFWLNMEQPEGVANQVAAAGGPGGLNLPGWDGLDFAGKVAAVQATWREPVRRLLVFDNLEQPSLLRAWRPTGGGSRVLITTRRGVWARSSGVQPVPLATLARPESMRLLLAPRYGDQVAAALADPATAQAADAICEQVGDLPLALALAGAYLEIYPSLSMAGYRTRLADVLLTHPSLEAEPEEGLPTQHVASVTATIALSYERLDPAAPADALALTVLHRAALLAPAPIPRRLLARLAERDPDDEGQAAEVDAPLRRLVALGLAELLPEGDGALHRLVAAFAYSHTPDAATDVARVRSALRSELSNILKAGYPLRGQPYLSHLQTAMQRMPMEAEIDDAILLNNLAILIKNQGDLTSARPIYERALAIFERVRGPDHPDTAASLNNLANLIWDQGDLTSARPIYERALAIYEHVCGPDHPDTADSLNNLANLRYTQGDQTGARSLYERALILFERVYGPDHPNTADILNNLALLLADQGDMLTARQLHERALAIRERALGPDHPDTAPSLNNLANLLADQGDLASARLFHERALAIHERTLGPDHPDTAKSLYNLALLRKKQGDLAGARQLFERALVIREHVLGPDHPETARVQDNLASLEHGGDE